MEKKLYRSSSDVKIAGVCSGIAEYFNQDPTLIRLLWVLAIFAGFSGVFAYIVCWIVMPEKPIVYKGDQL